MTPTSLVNVFDEHAHHKPSQSDPIVCDDSTDNTEFLFDMTHRPPNTKEHSSKHDRFPEPEEVGEEGEVEQQVGHI